MKDRRQAPRREEEVRAHYATERLLAAGLALDEATTPLFRVNPDFLAALGALQAATTEYRDAEAALERSR